MGIKSHARDWVSKVMHVIENDTVSKRLHGANLTGFQVLTLCRSRSQLLIIEEGDLGSNEISPKIATVFKSMRFRRLHDR